MSENIGMQIFMSEIVQWGTTTKYSEEAGGQSHLS